MISCVNSLGPLRGRWQDRIRCTEEDVWGEMPVKGSGEGAGECRACLLDGNASQVPVEEREKGAGLLGRVLERCSS